MKSSEKQSNILRQRMLDFKNILTDEINDCNQVFLTSHKHPDFDAIASLGAMALICKRLKKAPYIIIDDKKENMDIEVLSMIEKIKEKFIVITKDDYENNKTNNDLLILVDVNKDFMTCLENKYNEFKNVIIVDHHKEDEKTIKPASKLIVDEVSSCSEMFYYLLKYYNIVPSTDDYYTYLLAGIYLDTNKCSNNMHPGTYIAIKGLIESGADQTKVENLFSLDFASDRRVQRLIDQTNFVNLRIAISVNGSEEYTKEEIAMAADYMLKFGCDASIASGKSNNDAYFVSARTKNGTIGIDNIMRILNGGGGNLSSASCPPVYVDKNKTDFENANNLKEKIVKILTHKE